MTRFELADPDRGVYAAAGDGGAAVVCAGGRPVLAVAADRALRASGDPEGTMEVSLEADGIGLRAELAALGPAAALDGELVGSRRVRICRALGELRTADGGERPVASLGVVAESEREGTANVLRRSLHVVFGDGGLLALAAARPSGGAHGDEETVSVLVEPSGVQTRFDRALLSTEYDSAGAHRRATVELEISDEGGPPLRGAGSLVCGASVALPQLEVRTAFFRWALEGRQGLGIYEIARPL